MTPEQEQQKKQKWPFDPMQPGDHEPVRIPDEHPTKESRPPSQNRSSSDGSSKA
jgi:hypothetical protein